MKDPPAFHLTIPKTWDDREIASLEVPLANPVDSPPNIYVRAPGTVNFDFSVIKNTKRASE